MPDPDVIAVDKLVKRIGTPRAHTILEARRAAGTAVHDAFCHWARDATEETRNSPAAGKAAR